MKLNTKLTLFNTISKLVIVLFFVTLLPTVIRKITLTYTDNRLNQQKDNILRIIHHSGISTYIENGESFGSYTPLKEEYISLDVAHGIKLPADEISNEKRVIEKDTILYRILSHTFQVSGKNYTLEIGKSVRTIGEITSPLQNIGLGILLAMVVLTTIADLFYSKYVLRPLDQIIRTKLVNSSFPQPAYFERVKTTTSDFRYLDQSIADLMVTIEDKFNKEREFISNTSHELLTPISILQSKIENMFGEEEVSHTLKLSLLSMQKIVNRLKTTINTLLFISQIENEQFEKTEAVSMSEVIDTIYEELFILIEQKQITWTCLIPANLVIYPASRVLIFNLFFNLINNAVKYNIEQGIIKVSCIMLGKQYCVEIADTGIGISENEIPLLFSRLKSSKKPVKQDSYGLGLPIVKTIADFHQIRLEVISVPGKGSTFRLIFNESFVSELNESI